MNKNDEWLKLFYQDFKQHQTRYIRNIPPLSYTLWYRDKPMKHQVDLIEKPIYPKANMKRKKQFDSYGYYVDYRPGKYLNDPGNKNMPIDQYFEKNVNGCIIVDNSFLETHDENAYRAVILDGVQDYMLNYYPKVIENPHSYCKAVPSSCVVLVNMDGSYFYAIPLTHDAWLDEPLANLKTTNIGDDVKMNYHPLDMSNVSPTPIIKTTVAEIQQLLDAMSLTKIYVEDDEIYPSATSKKKSLLVDDNGEKYQTYKYTNAICLNKYFNTTDGVTRYYLVLKLSLYNRYSSMILPDTNETVEYITAYATESMVSDYAKSAEKYISKYIDNHYYKDGELYYTLTKNHSNSFWNNFFKRVNTQNVNHDLIGRKHYHKLLAYWSIFKKKNWSYFSDAQVEDVPLATHATTPFEPLAKPNGLNKVIMSMYSDSKHTCYVNHNELIQLDRVDNGQFITINVRRVTL